MKRGLCNNLLHRRAEILLMVRQSERCGSVFPAVLAMAAVNGCSTVAIAKTAWPKLKLGRTTRSVDSKQ